MNSLWTVALSVLAILLTRDLHVKRIGWNVIQFAPNRQDRPGKAHCIQRFSSRSALTQLMRFERS